MKKILAYLLIFSTILTGFAKAPDSKGKQPQLQCVAAAVIDQGSGRILYSKNEESTLAMASTTKIMTAIVALEKGNLNDIVIVSPKAVNVSGSTVGLRKGEKISLEELIYGLMLRSGNDAAIVIAEHIAGNTKDFVKIMNDKAIEIGAYKTSFVTPHGLDASGHFTTAEDLARITAYAMNNETFSKIVSAKEVSSGVSGKFNRNYSNINKFLYRIDNADGVKTGYTGNAGKCLVASIKHNYGRYICVVLNSADRWRDAEKLMKYAEDNYKFIKIMNSSEDVKRIRVYGGKEKYTTGKVKNDLYLPIKDDEFNKFKLDMYAPSVIFSPIEKGEIVGNVVAFIDNKIVAKYPVYSDKKIKRKNFADVIKDIVNVR